MDKISVVGLLLGLIAIIGGQALEGGHIGSLTQPTALLIVLGGTMGAVMLRGTGGSKTQRQGECGVDAFHAVSSRATCPSLREPH